jgi:hypothetical protein
MRYLRVRWNHEDATEPILLLSELDDEANEIRKIELFRDGTIGFADSNNESESTVLSEKPFLSEKPLPSIEEIASDPQFTAEWIDRSEFERFWESARRVPHFS